MMRVVKAGMCTYRDLCDGSLDMGDIWTMNDWLDLQECLEGELEERIRQEQKQ